VNTHPAISAPSPDGRAVTASSPSRHPSSALSRRRPAAPPAPARRRPQQLPDRPPPRVPQPPPWRPASWSSRASASARLQRGSEPGDGAVGRAARLDLMQRPDAGTGSVEGAAEIHHSGVITVSVDGVLRRQLHAAYIEAAAQLTTTRRPAPSRSPRRPPISGRAAPPSEPPSQRERDPRGLSTAIETTTVTHGHVHRTGRRTA